MDQKYARQILSEINKDYNAVAERFSRARPRMWPEMEFLFGKYINAGDKILDLGCGNGRAYPFVSGKGAFYTGVDFSEKLLKIAREKYPEADFQIGDALDLPLPDNSFSKILSVSVLHHIPSRELRQKFLKECRRILKPEGLLLLTAWNLWQNRRGRIKILKGAISKALGKSPLDFKDIKAGWYGAEDCYIHCFTRRELERAIKGGGFRMIKSGTMKLKNKKSLSNFFIVARRE